MGAADEIGAMDEAACEHATGRNAGGGAGALARRRPLPRLRTTPDLIWEDGRAGPQRRSRLLLPAAR